MTPQETDPLVAEALADYHRRRALGESPDPSTYKERLDDSYEDFVDVLAAEAMFDDLLEPATELELPRPFGEYTLLRELGRGAVGVVYEALHRKLGRRAALKVLRTGFDTDQLAKDRFLREAKACAQVRHDSIVEIYEADEVQGRPFYAMALIEGRTIEQILKDGEELDPKAVCGGLAGIAEALQRLHDAGIVHRDVKPSNVIVQPDGRMVLADFGLARTAVAETLSRTGTALGTPLYMSPEQMLGQREEIDGRSDVYGLGATLYQALCGVPPFKTGEVQALMRMVLSERPQDPGVHRDGLSQECGRIALKCLEKEKNDRYATARALQKDLLAFAEGRRVEGRPLSGAQRGLRAVRRHPLIAAAAVLLVGFGIWQLFLRPPQPAWLTAQVWPEASLHINDGEPIETPVSRYEVASNRRYTLKFQAEGFATHVLDWHPEPDEKNTINLSLRPVTRAALEKVSQRLEIKPEMYEQGSGPRSGPEDRDGVGLLYPRGRVRMEDLEAFAVFVEEKYLPGRIVFEIGDEVVSDEPFPEPENSFTALPIPQKFLDRVMPGDVVKWSYLYDETDRERTTTTFEVIGDEAHREIRHRLALIPVDDGSDAQISKNLRALRLRVYRQAGLDTAVFLRLTERRTIPAYEKGLDPTSASDLEAMLILRDSMTNLFENDMSVPTEQWAVGEALRQERWDPEVWSSLVRDSDG